MLAAGEGEVADNVQAVPAAAAQPGTTQMTTFGMNRISRCTSMMCRRPARAGSMVPAVSPSAYWYPLRPRMRWSPPAQKAQPPSFGDGPLPVSSTHPTSLDIRA